MNKLEKIIWTKIYTESYEKLWKQYNMTAWTVRYRKKKWYELTEDKLWGKHSIIHEEYNNTPPPKTNLDVYLKRIKRWYDFNIAIDPEVDLRKKEFRLLTNK